MRFRLRTLMGLLTLAALLVGTAVPMLRPSVYVRPNLFDAGNVFGGTHGTSVFNVSNRGSRPVDLRRHTTVGRARSDVDDLTIPAGEFRQILVSWQCPLRTASPAPASRSRAFGFKRRTGAGPGSTSPPLATSSTNRQHRPDNMLRFRLRTLLIAGAIGPPMIAGVWWLGFEGRA